MAFIIGALIGVALAWGPLSFLSGPVDTALTTLTSKLSALVGAPATQLGGLDETGDLALALSVAFTVLVPGVLALVAVLMAQSAGPKSRGASRLLVLAGLAGFFFLPAPAALLIFGVTILLAVLSFATAFAFRVGLWALALLLTARHLDLIFSAQYPAILVGAAQLQDATGMDASFWKLALTLAALWPFGAIASRVLSGADES